MNERTEIERRIATATSELASAELATERLSWARLGYFVVAFIALGVLRPAAGWVLAAIVPFAALVQMHRRSSSRTERARGARAASRGALARMDRDWANIPPLQGVDVSAMPNRAAIRDLDLYGERSLFRLLDVSQPALGATVTLRWLLEDPAPLAAIEARQASVQHLRGQPDFLFECARLCRHGSRPAPSGAKLLAFRRWCELPGDRFSVRLVWAARMLTTAFIAMIAVIVVRPALLQPLSSSVMAIVVGQFAVAALARRYLHDRLREAADLLTELTGVVEVLRLAVALPDVAGRFGEIQRSLTDSGASDGFSRLSRLFAWNAAHHSPMLLAALDGLVAFDAHLAAKIDDWREAFGARLPQWIDLVAEAQALTALATLAYENPQWTMPRVHDDDAPILEAAECGHPLIANGVRVTNPVAIERPASAIIVSGSNMSGKTTYLRAVGVDALLAFAGGPVCAGDLTIRRSRVRTTVRIEDNLGAGVSLFLAEVSRIAEIVGDAGSDTATPVLFLFDEILHGTNAQDRREATQLVLERLLASGAAGIITTHDPRIADVEDRMGDVDIVQVHFTDSVETRAGQVTMTFDYILRPGAATTTNALRILEALNLSARPAV
jgi:hypothetical protein